MQLSLGPVCRTATKLTRSAPERVTCPALFRAAPGKRYAVPDTGLACMAVEKVVSRLPARLAWPGVAKSVKKRMPKCRNVICPSESIVPVIGPGSQSSQPIDPNPVSNSSPGDGNAAV